MRGATPGRRKRATKFVRFSTRESMKPCHPPVATSEFVTWASQEGNAGARCDRHGSEAHKLLSVRRINARAHRPQRSAEGAAVPIFRDRPEMSGPLVTQRLRVIPSFFMRDSRVVAGSPSS